MFGVRSPTRKLVLAVCFAALATALPAHAQTTLVERIQSALDEVARGLNSIGQKAGDIVGPGLRLDEEEPARFTEKRSYNEHFPVVPSPAFSVSNEFGNIHVETWENRVVEVTAEMTV